ncbi:hypothetical protein Tco_1106407 [Tanacetum coccineum]
MSCIPTSSQFSRQIMYNFIQFIVNSDAQSTDRAIYHCCTILLKNIWVPFILAMINLSNSWLWRFGSRQYYDQQGIYYSKSSITMLSWLVIYDADLEVAYSDNLRVLLELFRERFDLQLHVMARNYVLHLTSTTSTAFQEDVVICQRPVPIKQRLGYHVASMGLYVARNKWVCSAYMEEDILSGIVDDYFQIYLGDTHKNGKKKGNRAFWVEDTANTVKWIIGVYEQESGASVLIDWNPTSQKGNPLTKPVAKLENGNKLATDPEMCMFAHHRGWEEVYVAQPRRIRLTCIQEKVYRLRKALYGLKQAPRACLIADVNKHVKVLAKLDKGLDLARQTCDMHGTAHTGLYRGVLYYGIYGVCIGILACRGLSLVSSPLHAMKSQSQIQSSAAVNLGIWDVKWRNPILSYAGRIRKMSQSLSNNIPDNSPEQEAATGHSILRRLDSPTSKAIQIPELELTLTLATGREHSQEINNLSVPVLISQASGPSRKRSRSPSSPFFPDVITFSDGKPTSETSELNPEDVTARLEDLEVEIDTLHADTEDKELLISELQDSLAAAESEIAILQIKVADTDTESRRAEDHEQIQKILARLGL